MSYRLVLGFLILAIGFAWPVSADARSRRDRLTVEEQYELGQRYLRRGYYVKAIEQFNRIRNYHRDDPYAVKAELAIADVYYKKSEWDQARMAYEDFMRMHPRHPDLDYVVFRVGMSVYQKAPRAAGRDQTWTRQAVNSWSGFESRFPSSTYKDDVLDLLHTSRERLARKEYVIARFYVRRKAWKAVEGRAAGLVDAYPDSRYAADTLSMLAVAHAWQGEAEEAERALEELRKRDPEAAGRTQARIARIPPPAGADG